MALAAFKYSLAIQEALKLLVTQHQARRLQAQTLAEFLLLHLDLQCWAPLQERQGQAQLFLQI